MNILITGVAGLLGSHLARSFIENGHHVIGVDSLIGGYIDNVPGECEFYSFDLMDMERIDEVFSKPVDLVVHAACTAHEGLSVFSPAFISKNTFQITLNIMSMAIRHNVKKFVYMSSMARYGKQETPFTEDMIPRPQDPYGISKVAAEESIRNLCQTHGLDFVIMVPHNIIGPGQKYDDPYRNVAAIMINRMLQGKQPIIYGDGEQSRCFSFISDVVSPLMRACLTDSANSKVVNIGPDEDSVTINQLAIKIAHQLSFDLKPIYVPERPQEVKIATCSSNLSRKLLGYETKVSLDQGLAELISYIRTRGTLPFSYSFELEIKSQLTPTTWTNKLI
jgi:UDP-glucose 4-epimerase